ncbi:MAG: type II secretion system F family protein [bacterium]
MPKYSYIAKSLAGETKSGVLEAKDERQLAADLRRDGLILIKIGLDSSPSKKKIFSFSFFGPSLAEKMFFTKNLQVMVGAGLPLPRALDTLGLQAKNEKFRKAIEQIKKEVTEGKSFSEAISGQPKTFSDFFLNMVRAGEEGGTLEKVLKTLTLQMERENELKSRIKGAMIYPAVILAAMVGIGTLMLIMVVPKLAETFNELGAELPLTTRLVLKFADFLTKKWYFVLVLFLALFFGLKEAMKNKEVKKIINIILLKAPIISPLIKKTNTAYTARNLSSLVAAGISLPRALEIVSGTLGNAAYKKVLLAAKEEVKKGEKLSVSLKTKGQIYPATLVQMIEVGEETGETSSILAKLADFYEEEVSNDTKNLSSIIEPVLMILIGTIVGFFAVSMIQPMYSMLGEMQ